MRNRLILLLFSLLVTLPGNADDILAKKVPWSGELKRTTLGEVVARVSGWAEGSDQGEIKFTIHLSRQDRARYIDTVRINKSKDKESTYRDVIQEAYRQAGLNVSLETVENRIKVTHLLTRRWNLSFGTVGKWKRDKIWGHEQLSKELKRRGWTFSKHFTFNMISTTFVAKGTKEDITKVDRFLKLSK